MRWHFAAALVLVGCGAPPRVLRPGTLVARHQTATRASTCDDLHAGTSGERVCAIATLDVEAGVVDVLVRVEPGILPPERSEVTLHHPGGVHSLGAVAQAVEHHYRVVLEGRMAPGRSWRHATGWHLAGASFMPEIRVDSRVIDAPATLLLDVGDEPLFTSAGPGHRVFDAPHLSRLAGESYEVGAIMMSRREIDSDTLWVGGTERSDGELEAAADALAVAYRELQDELGEAPTEALLVMLHSPDGSGDGTSWGERSGSSVTLVVPASDDTSAMVADALKPLVQLFLVGAGQADWLSEGLPEYLATRVGVGLLELPPEAFARAMLRHSSAPADAVSSGVLTSFCLDAYLRGSASSLATVLRAASDPVTSESLLFDLAAISPPAAGYLAALATDEDPLAIDACLSRIGFRTETHAFAAPSSEAYREALGVESWGALEHMPLVRVEAVAEGSPLEAGDLIWRVEDAVVAEPTDVAWALRDAAVGDPVELSLRRRGELTTLSVTLGDLPAERVQHSYRALLSADAEPAPSAGTP